MMRRVLVLSLALACASTQADALTDLTTKLKTLAAPTPVKGELDASYDEFDAKGAVDKAKSARFRLEVDGSDGLHIHLSPELVQTLSEEEAANVADPEQPTPNMDLLRQTNALRIQHMLSAAPTLLRDLDGATGLVTKLAKLGDVQVTQLTVNLPFRAPKKDSNVAKDWQDSFTVWLDPQGVPLQVKDQVHAKFCKYFLCVHIDDSYSDTLRVVDGRLVITTLSQEHQQSGLGQDAHTKTTATLQLQ
jgi:hypothetical protein